MNTRIRKCLQKLSSRSVLERKAAIKDLCGYLGYRDAYLARLSLHYVSEHDPCYTVRNIARQSFYRIGSSPPTTTVWDKVHVFE